MKHIFIINPVAGKGQMQKTIAQQVEQLQSQHDCEIYYTTCEGDAKRYAEDRCTDHSCEELRFYACGGDGTLFEVINGVRGRASVGCIPCGSGNDFIKNIDHANFLDLESQLMGQPHAVDLLKCDDQYVSNTCNVGFDADIARQVTRFKYLPFCSGKMAYILSLLYCFFRKLRYPMEVVIDGQTFSKREFLFALAANGKIYGGGFRGAPLAKINDGKIDLCLCGPVGRLVLMKMASKFRSGEHVTKEEFRPYISYQTCTKLELRFAQPTVVCFDGNCKELSQLDIEICPQALSFVIPRGGTIA